jgi:nitrite reductase/ring-hydroxylating ferredoxin subunit
MNDYRLCAVLDIPEEESRGFVIERKEYNLSLVAVKKDGVISIYENSCPHLGVPMNMEPDRFLDVEKNFIICSTHGALFEIETGDCVHGPCLGKKLTPVPHDVRGEEVFIAKAL